MEKFHIVSKDLKTGEKRVKTNIPNNDLNDVINDLSHKKLDDDKEIDFFTSVENVLTNDLSNIVPVLSVRLSAFDIRTKKIFIVHGHNKKILNKVCEYVRSLNIEPIVLSCQSDEQLTLIEKLEETIGLCEYGIVIYSKCDVGFDKNKPLEASYRARQNVVFEHGYLNGKLSRKKVCVVLESKDIEIPGDIKGILYADLSTKIWKEQLKNNLIEAGLLEG